MAFKYLVPIEDLADDYLDEITTLRSNSRYIDITDLTPEQRQGVTMFIDRLLTFGFVGLVNIDHWKPIYYNDTFKED